MRYWLAWCWEVNVVIVLIIIHELAILTGEIGHEELERAKTQLKSMLLMNLESRPVIFEDLARQVLAQGIRQKPEHYIARINKIGKDDINRIARKMLTSKPSVAAIGSLKTLPSYKDIELGLLHKDGVMPKKKQFSVFRWKGFFVRRWDIFLTAQSFEDNLIAYHVLVSSGPPVWNKFIDKTPLDSFCTPFTE